MAEKRNILSDQDTIYGDVLQGKQGKEVNYELPGHLQGEIENPESKWSLTGRGCPKDAGPLAYFEINEKTGVQWYYCKTCGTRYTENELSSDEVYRIVPNNVVLRYVEDMKRKGR